MPLLFASYLTDVIKQDLRTNFPEEETDQLFVQMSSFELHSNSNLEDKSKGIDPIVAVVSNLISRGRPTPAPTLLEKAIQKTLHLTAPSITKSGRTQYLPKTLFQAYSEPARVLINRNFGNDQRTIVETDNYKQALFLTHLPIGVAWLQKSILEFIATNKLNLKKKSWSIGIIEQDVACAHLAIQHLQATFHQLFALEGQGRKLPTIDLTIFSTETSIDNAIDPPKNPVLIKGYKEKKGVDLLLDIAVLTDTRPYEDYKVFSKFSGKIRNSEKAATPKFYTSAFINYQGEAEEPISYLLQEIFRKENNSEVLVKTIVNGLQQKSIVAQMRYPLLFESMQMLTLLQPAPSIVFCQRPDTNFHLYQKSKNYGIDAIHSLADGMEALPHSSTLLTAVDAPNSLRPAFKTKLVAVGVEQQIAHLFLWEAHACSQWSADFQNGYGLATKNLKRVFGRNASLPVIGLTGSGSAADLRNCQALVGNQASILKESIKINKDFKVSIKKPAPINKKQIEAEVFKDMEWAYKRAIGINTQEALGELIDQLHQTKQKTLVICPFETGYFGVDDTEELNKNPNHVQRSVAGYLKNKYNALAIGSYFYSPDQRHSSHRLQYNRQQLQNWSLGKLDILIANRQLLPDLDLEHIDHIIHFSLPDSIPGIYESTYHSILGLDDISHHIIHSFESPTKVQQVAKSTARENLFHFHKYNFKGRAKEKWILQELLSEISFPSSLTVDNELTQKIATESGVKVRLNLIALRLYILDYNKEKTYGYIDLSNPDFQPTHFLQAEERQLSEKILGITKIFIEEKRNVVNYFSKWIETFFRPAPVVGLEPRLEAMEVGDSDSFEIGFVNNTIEKIQDIINNLFEGESVIYNIEIILQSEATLKISLEEDIFQKAIWKASQESFTPAYFIKKVSEFYKLELRKRDERKNVFYKDYIVEILLPADDHSRGRIEQLLLQMRTPSDTEKAMHTLASIGIIEDYSLHQENETCTIYFQKKAASVYLNNLQQHLCRHTTDAYATQKLSALNSNKKETASLKQIIDQLIDFVYDFIEPKRSLEMEKIIASSLLEGEPIPSLLDMHFSSRYGHSRHLPNLADDLQDRGKDIGLVWEYLDHMHTEKQDFSFVSNLEQLESVTKKLLIANPNHPVLQLLLAFTNTYFSTWVEDNKLKMNKQKFKQGITHYLEGFMTFNNLYAWEYSDFKKNIDLFNDKLTNCRKPLELPMLQAADWLQLEAKNRWLKNFNSQVKA